MREAREKPSSLPSGRVCVGGASSPVPTPWGLFGEGKHDTCPKATREVREQRPTYPHHLVQGWGLQQWEGEWEEAAKAVGK